MRGAFVVFLGGVLASPALAGTTSASVGAMVEVVDGGGIQVLSPLALPSVSASPAPESVTGNAELTVRAEPGSVLSMAVPTNLTLVRDGGSEELTVETTTHYGLAGRGVLMDGSLINGNAMSVDIGGKLSLASADHLVPGPYEGLFVVVVEYN